MSLFQNLLKTYEQCKDAIGVSVFNVYGEIDEKKTLLPIYHTIFKSQIRITLASDGSFINASRDNKDIVIIVPCTESSGGRTSGISAHPLCDQIDYVGSIYNRKTSAYLDELGKWMTVTNDNVKIKLNAIFKYVNTKKMISDLEDVNIFKDDEYLNQDKMLKIDYEKIRKIGIRFSVEIKDDLVPNVWEDEDIRQSWIDYTNSKNDNNLQELFDYLGGARVGHIASQHPKNINLLTANAKLLSCNDTSEYTFRGRFLHQNDAVIIDYQQSQKIHQTLRWLISNFGYNTDSQAIVVWAVDSEIKPIITPFEDSFSLWEGMASEKTDNDKLVEASGSIDTNYVEKLKKVLQGYMSAEKIKKHTRKICIAVFDAATTGRMGLTYYQELGQDKYLENIVAWHEETSYFLVALRKEKDANDKEKTIVNKYIGAPSYDDILFAVYGKARGGNDAGYSTLKRKVRKQLLECMFGNFSFPKNIVDMAAVRASNPMSFENELDWDKSINISCALIRKYYIQNRKVGIDLELDKTMKDRDYLYGRLLAVADRIEQVAMYKSGKNDTRATNAIRLMSAFAVKPYNTWGVLYQQLIPYINQLNGAGFYQSIIDEISVQLSDSFADNRPLAPIYLLGFSAQRRDFIKNKNESVEDIENDITE